MASRAWEIREAAGVAAAAAVICSAVFVFTAGLTTHLCRYYLNAVHNRCVYETVSAFRSRFLFVLLFSLISFVFVSLVSLGLFCFAPRILFPVLRLPFTSLVIRGVPASLPRLSFFFQHIFFSGGSCGVRGFRGKGYTGKMGRGGAFCVIRADHLLF